MQGHLPDLGKGLGVLLLVLFVAAPAGADSLVSLPDPGYAEPAPGEPAPAVKRRVNHLVYPTIGFPAIVESGGELTPRIRLDDGGASTDWDLRIVTAADPVTQTYRCKLRSSDWDPATKTYALVAEVPADAPRDHYDLWIYAAGLPGGHDVQDNAVRVVGRIKDDFRFVHISDSQVNDWRAPDPSVVGRMLEQIRFLDPEFVVFSGDLNYGKDYDKEYSDAHRIFEEAGLCVFMVPGNHDGHATVQPVTSPSGVTTARIERDGLQYWRQFIGPLYYSFDYGGRWHFTALNSFDGGPKRRNSRGARIINYGGQVDPAQLAWAKADVLAASTPGRNVVLLAHHDPRGNFKPNKASYPWTLARQALMSWHQTWNDAASRDALLDLTADSNVSHWLIGHKHNDKHDVEIYHAGTPRAKEVHFVRTTTMAASSDAERLGLRILEVRSGAIVDYDFDASAKLEHLPFGRPQHLVVEEVTPNNGGSDRVKLRVVNVLSRDVRGTVELYAAAAPYGYDVTGGTVRRVVTADQGASVLYVDVTVGAGSTLEVGLAPAGPGGSSAVYPASRTIPSPPAAGGRIRVDKRRGLRACALFAPMPGASGRLEGRGDAASVLAPLAFLFAALLLLRRRVAAAAG